MKYKIVLLSLLMVNLIGNSFAQYNTYGLDPYEQITPLIQKYNDKKIQRVLVQHSTGKVMVFLKGAKKLIEFKEEEAIAEGILPNPLNPIPLSTDKNKRYVIIKSDSILYLDKANHVMLNIENKDDTLWTLNAYITHIKDYDTSKSTNEFYIKPKYPGPVNIMVADKKTGNIKMQYNFKATYQDTTNRVISLAIGNKPEGIINGGRYIDYRYFKQADSISTGSIFKFVSATVYFSGVGFKHVFTTTLDTPALEQISFLTSHCVPSSCITFDNVKIMGPDKRIRTIQGGGIVLIDSNDIRKDYSSLYSDAYFPNGEKALIDYLKSSLAYMPSESADKNYIHVSVNFVVLADGTVQDISQDFIPKGALESKYYEAIKKGPKWKPAKFDGKPVSSIHSQSIFLTVY